MPLTLSGTVEPDLEHIVHDACKTQFGCLQRFSYCSLFHDLVCAVKKMLKMLNQGMV